MLLIEAAPVTTLLGDSEVIKALIGGVATIVVAALGLYGVIRQANKPSRTKPPVGETAPNALEQFNGTQNEFMALVIADNRTMREELGGLRTTVDSIKTHQETFLGAVRRYLMKLATAWGHDSPMPWPDDNDFHILEDTLPVRGKGNIERKES